MPKFDNDTLARWTAMVDARCALADLTRSEVTDGRAAWMIAHGAKITDEAYADRSVTDAHIKTALTKIFPNAVFKDRYAY